MQRGLSLEVANQAVSEIGWGPKLALDTWYYLEEVWVRETSTEAADGSYTMYVGKAYIVTDETPAAVMQAGLTFGNIKNLSIMGNT